MDIDAVAGQRWQRTGYRFFPYAAKESGTWWVLRLNVGFPEHDLYTLFIDSQAVADVTSDDIRAVGDLAPDVAAEVVRQVAGYLDYGSEHGDPCGFCSGGRDGMTRGTLGRPRTTED